MARRIRSQKEALEKMAEEERKQKEEVEKAKEELSVLEEELRKMQEEFEESSKACKEAEQELAHLKKEEEKKEAEIKSLLESEANARAELTQIVNEKIKLQNEIRITKGVITPRTHRIIRIVRENETEIGRIPIKYVTTLLTPENSVLTKLAIGDYVSYIGDEDEGTITWRVWQKMDSSVLITPVLNDSCKKLELFGVTDYLDIVRNAPSQTDKINRACKKWYVNKRLGITAENIRSMTIEDINEVCGYTPPEISTRYAYYLPDTYVSGEIMYNGSRYIKQEHSENSHNGYTTSRFYTYDGGGVEKVDSNGYTYREPKKYSPVYVSNTGDEYDPSYYTHKDNPSINIGDLLGEFNGWLASSCVWLDERYAFFEVCCACSNKVDAHWVACSDGDTYATRCDLRPLISLNATLKVVGGDGTKEAPWEIAL